MPAKKAINKIDSNGKIVAIYDGYKEAQCREQLTYAVLSYAVASGKEIGGFTYEFSDKTARKPTIREEHIIRSQFPWEGANGFFNIKGWAQACY